MANHEDNDWIYPERETVDVTADTERPASVANRFVWRCDDEGAEPTQHASLIAATCEPPMTSEAQVYGGGALLAIAHADAAVWSYTNEGAVRLSNEAHGIMKVAS